jgi:drug/metabolite transporter (DMT)-like permease
MIWSAHPLMSKLVLADFTPAQGAWLRYTSALVSFLVARACFRRMRTEPFFFARSRSDWITVVAVGGMAFCLSPLFQLSGLLASRATDNALIIAMEPMMTVFLVWVILGEKITASYLFMFGVALGGFALLAGVSLHGLELSPQHFWGNVLMLIALLGEASYSVGGRKLLDRHSPISIFGLAIFSGVMLLTICVFVLSGEGPWVVVQATVHHLSWKSALALAWLGPLGTTASYLYWMYALQEAPVSSVALTLFVQPVFGSVLGYLFLGERLTGSQSLGGALIILAVFAQTLGSIRDARAVPPTGLSAD